MGKHLANDPQRAGKQIHRYRGRITALKVALQGLLDCVDVCDGHGMPKIKDRAACYLAVSDAQNALKDAVAEEWTPVDQRLPDDDITVMVAVSGWDEPVWFGWHDAEGWISATDGAPITKMVTHWKPVPAGPA